MRCDYNSKTGEVKFTPDRWQEYFVVYISDEIVKQMKESKIPSIPFYFPVRYLVSPSQATTIWEYWIYPLVPFVYLIQGIDNAWRRIGAFFARRGMLKAVEGKPYHWYWPIWFFVKQ
jgi:hypothetical protein